MKKILLAILVIATAVGCMPQSDEINLMDASATRIYATFGKAETKTFVDEGLHQKWQAGDEIAVAEEGRDGFFRFKYVGETADGKGIFEPDEYIMFSPSTKKYAIYPYCKAESISADYGKGRLKLLDRQHYVENSFAPDENVMLGEAASGSNNLVFSNTCGYVVFRFYGDATIRSIQLDCASLLTGNIGCIFPGAGGPSLDWSAAYVAPATTVTLDCGKGVKLGTTPETATEFWFVVPPTERLPHIELTITDSQGNKLFRYTDEVFKVERNVVHKFKPFLLSFPNTPNLAAPEDECSIPSAGGMVEVCLLGNVDFDILKPAECDWLDVSAEGNLIRFTAGPSPDGKPRHADVTFENETLGLSCGIKVNQLQANPIVDVGEEYWLEGDEQKITLKKLVPGEIGIEADGFVTNSWWDSTDKELCMGVDYTDWPHGERSCTMTFTYNGESQVVTFRQKSSQEIYDRERAALMALYNSTGGPQWEENTCWGSDIHISQWYGVECRPPHVVSIDMKRVNNLGLYIGNNLDGPLPSELGDLKELERLSLPWNHITGNLPASMGNLVKLTELDLSSNAIEGSIPDSFNNLFRLRLSNCNLGGNRLSGPIPSKFTTDPRWIGLPIPDLRTDIGEMTRGVPFWFPYYTQILSGNLWSLEAVPIYHNEFKARDVYGNWINSAEFFAEHSYTIMFLWRTWCPYTDEFIPKVKWAYNAFKDKGLAVLGFSDEDDESLIRKHAESREMPWPTIQCGHYPVPGDGTPSITIIDRAGNVVFSDVINDSRWDMNLWLSERLGAPSGGAGDEAGYASTDYSADGTVHVLQEATVGDGIDIVLMGDAYSDRLIADGTYANVMNQAMEAFFEEEPFKSYRNRFNVIYVDVVSKNEVFYGQTALNTWYGEGVTVGGDNQKVYEYASAALESTGGYFSDAVVIVLMNRYYYAGTCYMFPLESGDHGRGYAFAYMPVGQDGDDFGRILRHEACGHGFAKLADEYGYKENGAIPQSGIDHVRDLEPYGWWKNIDFTFLQTEVKWRQFIADERYASEKIDCYEGGYTYWSGVWRPTENSIMRDNNAGFNAPSRYAIWYRINKLANPSWNGTYEDFVEFDMATRPAAAQQNRIRTNYVEDERPQLPPPVVIRDAKWK